MRPNRAVVGIAVVATLLLAACGGSSDPSRRTTSGTKVAGPALDGEITVAAAASLTEPFTAIGSAFEDEHPGTTITFTFDSSGTLARQIAEGAPADVFASADPEHLAEVAAEDLLASEPKAFARNRLAIVTKPGNPEGIESLADLADVGTIALCGEDVPCGTFADRALDGAGVTVPESAITRGQNAKATLAAVSEGDAVAGIVYLTDARAAGDAVDAVEIPDDQNVVATYPIAVLSDSSNAELAQAFVDQVTSAAGRAILEEQGFLPPT